MVERSALIRRRLEEAWELVFESQRSSLTSWFAQALSQTKEEYRQGLPDVGKFVAEWDGRGMPVIIDPRFDLGVVLENTETVPDIDTANTKDVVNVLSRPYIAEVDLGNASSFEEAESRLEGNTGITGATALEGVLFRIFFPSSVRMPNYCFGSRTAGIHIPRIGMNSSGKNKLGIELPIGKNKKGIRFLTVLKRQ